MPESRSSRPRRDTPASRMTEGVGRDVPPTGFSERLLGALPRLRSIATAMVMSSGRADDLVQDTLLKAWTHRDQFAAGTDLFAWLVTIMRNTQRTAWRRAHHERSHGGPAVARLASLPRQPGRLDLLALRREIRRLSPEQREALLLVAGSGLSYHEVARICRTTTGTIKSRVSRARKRLATALAMQEADDFGPGGEALAAIQGRLMPEPTE